MAQTYLENLLGDRERVQHVARQHWILLARNIVAEILVIMVILAAMVLIILEYPLYALPAAVIGFLLILLPIFTMTRDILNYTNNQYIITSRRVIHLQGVLDKSTTDSSLEKVNDVHMTQTAMGRMFNYGDVEILTASELGVNTFKQINDPVRFKTAMLNAKQSLEDRDDFPVQAVQAMRPPDDIPALLEKLGVLRQQGLITEEEFMQKKAQLLERL